MAAPNRRNDVNLNPPLAGIRVVEFAGLAPGPMVGMILADFGADVVRVDRCRSFVTPPTPNVLGRGKRSIAINTKTRGGYLIVRKLVEGADVLIEPFRPGVMERLNLGPDLFLGESGFNKRLVYSRLVGFPRSGPHKDMAGHDLNYLALSGVLSMLPGHNKPEFPANILADFAGGGLMCAMGILLALIERNRSGLGQVVNTDMVSGVRYLSTFPLLVAQLRLPAFGQTRGTGMLDGGAPFYNVYTCADGRWMSVACLEPHFFRTFLQHFLRRLPHHFALADGWRPSEDDRLDTAMWPRMKEFFDKGFRLHPRDYWAAAFQGTDACAVPVLSRQEAASLASKTHGREFELTPNPHPGLSRTPPIISWQSASEEDIFHSAVLTPGADTDEILSELGISDEEKMRLRTEGALSDLPQSKL